MQYDLNTFAAHVDRQLAFFAACTSDMVHVFDPAWDRFDRCRNAVAGLKGWAAFDPTHTDQYAVFLYYLANTAHKRGHDTLATAAYALNKMLHGLDAFYEVELPDMFAVVHPVGTVLGRARYADWLLVYQNVTVGGDPFTHAAPTIGEGVILYGGSRVIGAAVVGQNVLVSAGCTVRDKLVPDDCVAFGGGSKPTRRNVKRDVFKCCP